MGHSLYRSQFQNASAKKHTDAENYVTTPGAILCLSGLGSDIGYQKLKDFFEPLAKVSYVDLRPEKGKVMRYFSQFCDKKLVFSVILPASCTTHSFLCSVSYF